MKRLFSFALALLLAFPTLGQAENVSFPHCKLADAKGTQAKATLTFDDATKEVAIKLDGRDAVSIPYVDLDKISYEYSRKHRITTGAFLLAVTPFGVGGLVMLSKSKSHWLSVDFHDQEGKRTVVLKLDKYDIHAVFDAFRTHAGKDVVNVGETGKKQPHPSVQSGPA
jgi:hypothetical protein